MGIAAQCGDILHRIAGCHTCAKALRTDIDSIGTVVYCRDATFQVLGRSQKFYALFHIISALLAERRDG